MCSLRTMIIAGSCCVLVSVGLFFYVKYNTQRFAASLPQPPVLESRAARTSGIGQPRWNSDISMIVEQVAADEIATQKQSVDIRDALSFDFTDRQMTYTRLEVHLRTVYAEDPKVDRFLVLWTAMSDVLQATKSYENDGNMALFWKMAPGATLNEFVGLGIELFKLNDTDAAAVLASAAHWSDTVYRLQIANEALPYIQDALNTGEMTLDEAKAFFKAVCDLDVDIEIIK